VHDAYSNLAGTDDDAERIEEKKVKNGPWASLGKHGGTTPDINSINLQRLTALIQIRPTYRLFRYRNVFPTPLHQFYTWEMSVTGCHFSSP
jgi:hypothetical protein